jgi:hypothetical protein
MEKNYILTIDVLIWIYPVSYPLRAKLRRGPTLRYLAVYFTNFTSYQRLTS